MRLRKRQEPFVEKSVAALHKHGNTLGVAPTGAGKTVMLSAIAKEIPGNHLILQHRGELITQNRRTYKDWTGREGSIMRASVKDWSPATFAMVQTLARPNTLEAMPAFDFLIIDEAHHAAAVSYRNVINRAKELNPDVKVLGVTATPNRGDKKGLIHVFNNVSDQIEIGELVNSGDLVRPSTLVVDVGVQDDLQSLKKTAEDFDMEAAATILNTYDINARVVEEWREHAGNRKTVVFCATVEHARSVEASFRAEGVSAMTVFGTTPDDAREGIYEALATGDLQVLINVMVCTEGWDCPPVSCVVLLRPSAYHSTFVQMVGRGLRKLDAEKFPNCPPKLDCKILDFGTASITHGTLEQIIDLKGHEPDPGQAPYKDCPECEAEVPLAVMECPCCGHVFEPVGDEEGKEPAAFVMTEMDLLAESNFQWEDFYKSSVRMASGFDAWACMRFNPQDELWHVFGGTSERNTGRKIFVGEKIQAQATASDWMNRKDGVGNARKTKAWLKQNPTEKQIELLGKNKIKIDPVFPEINKYQATCLLQFCFNKGRMKM